MSSIWLYGRPSRFAAAKPVEHTIDADYFNAAEQERFFGRIEEKTGADLQALHDAEMLDGDSLLEAFFPVTFTDDCLESAIDEEGYQIDNPAYDALTPEDVADEVLRQDKGYIKAMWREFTANLGKSVSKEDAA